MTKIASVIAVYDEEETIEELTRRLHRALTDLAGSAWEEPSRDGILHEAHVMSWIASTEPLTRYLAVLLDAHGVVVDLYWDIPTEIPWVPTDQCRGR